MTGDSAFSENAYSRLAEHKARLVRLREEGRQLYAGGTPVMHVAAFLSEMTDRFVVELFERVLQQLPSEQKENLSKHVSVLAVGGSGRGEAAPYSDADILILHQPGLETALQNLLTEVVRDCWDVGIRLAHSVRTLPEALEAALEDPPFSTALVEARLLWGSQHLFDKLRLEFSRHVVRSRLTAFYNDCLSARAAEWNHFGPTVRQLEPDVKRSAGGLRDIHLIRWIGFARFATTDIEQLQQAGVLLRDDVNALRVAQEFLTRVRFDLHFSAGKSQEVLTRSEQLRLTELYGYTPTAAQRPVERFMQTYFRHTSLIADIAARFVAMNRPESARIEAPGAQPVRRERDFFTISPEEIDVVPRYRERVCGSLELVLTLFELAQQNNVRVAPWLFEAVNQAAPGLPREMTAEASRIFLTILSKPGQLGQVLRAMYNSGVLEIILPEMSHAHCLLQFNEYHNYTVDEHTLRAVEAAELQEQDSGPIGQAYRSVPQKDILHLALLLHDLGKGYEEDHSEVGRRLAEDVATRLGLSDHLRNLLVFLVHKHLMMSHLALRRDLSDPEVLSRFSRDVGSPEQLRMLYVLTAADLKAVGPGIWTDWKADLLTELYDRAMLILSGENQYFLEEERLRRVCEDVLASLSREANVISTESAGTLLQTFPARYLMSTPPEQIAADLKDIESLIEHPLVIHGRHTGDSNAVEYRVIADHEIGAQCFSQIAGVLTAKGLGILSANICTTSTGVVVDAFRVIDGDYSGKVPDYRLHEVETSLREALLKLRTVESLFRRHSRFVRSADLRSPLAVPTRVVVDNVSSEGCTIIDVFAHDRRGLLYAITSALLELDLSVTLAKIATHIDQVLDVFYVTDRAGAKIEDEQRLQHIQESLLQRIEQFERTGLAATSEAKV